MRGKVCGLLRVKPHYSLHCTQFAKSDLSFKKRLPTSTWKITEWEKLLTSPLGNKLHHNISHSQFQYMHWQACGKLLKKRGLNRYPCIQPLFFTVSSYSDTCRSVTFQMAPYVKETTSCIFSETTSSSSVKLIERIWYDFDGSVVVTTV